jgi:hypothetical protein
MISLASTFEADPPTIILYKAETPEALDREQRIRWLLALHITDHLSQVLKYTVIYIIVICFLASLIALREY